MEKNKALSILRNLKSIENRKKTYILKKSQFWKIKRLQSDVTFLEVFLSTLQSSGASWWIRFVEHNSTNTQKAFIDFLPIH